MLEYIVGSTTWVGIAANEQGRLRVFITRNLVRELFFMRSRWAIRVVDLEAFLLYREADLRFKQLERSSPGALKAFVDERNPKWNDLLPEPVTAGEVERISASAPVVFELSPLLPHDAFWKLRNLPPGDYSPGLGGVGAVLPTGPRPKVGMDARAWPLPDESDQIRDSRPLERQAF
ncbi:MAG: hypothetical protein ABL962_00835 [Fimbriimonadaceae bacterium]